MHLIDGPLNDDVRPGLKGEGTCFFLKLGASQRPFDVAGARVMSFDQVGVVAVHHTDEIGKFGCAVRMQPLSQPGGFPLDVDRKVCQFCGNMLLEEAGFDRSFVSASNGLSRICPPSKYRFFSEFAH